MWLEIGEKNCPQVDSNLDRSRQKKHDMLLTICATRAKMADGVLWFWPAQSPVGGQS